MYEWTVEKFKTKDEATAFVDGLTYGDDPEWIVNTIRCIDNWTSTSWDVLFARPETVEQMDEDA